MRQTEVELRLSRSLRQEAIHEGLILSAPKPNLQRWAKAMGTTVARRPRVLLMRPNDPITRNLAIFLSEERTLPIQIDVLEQKVVTEGIANALHEKAELERQKHHAMLGRLAAGGWAGGPILGLAGATAENVITTVVGVGGALAGGSLEWWLSRHPFEPTPLTDLPDIEPAVLVAHHP